MKKNNQNKDRTRRGFLSLFLNREDNKLENNLAKPEKIKMLTADGKLVEVDKVVLDAVSKNQKSSNKEIYNWMDNPSKANDI